MFLLFKREEIINYVMSLIYFFFLILDKQINSSNIDSLLQELKILGYLGFHLNIIQLIGCYTSQLTSRGLPIILIFRRNSSNLTLYIGIAYVFVEYCSNGDLKHWLKTHSSNYSAVSNDSRYSMVYELKKRLSASRNTNSLQQDIAERKTFRFNDTDLIFFAYQIAKGMEYLASRRFLHRDLAARNILLNDLMICKISDFGLADESKLTSQAYFGRVNSHIPVKWAPPEVLLDLKYEANSDV